MLKLELRPEFGKLKRYIYDREGDKSIYVINRIESKDMSEDDLVSPTTDRIFKIMFQSEETRINACYLVSLLFQVDMYELYEKMRIYNTELKMDNVQSKNQRVDFVGLVQDTFISIEMNNTNELGRNDVYANKLSIAFEKSGVKGEDYRSVIQININNFKIRGIDNTINVSESTDGRYRRTKILFIDIYLPNINEKYELYGIKSLSDTERRILAMFISKYSKAKELAKGEEILMDFIEKLRLLGDDNGLLRSYDHELVEKQAAERDGIKKGKEQNQIETANNMIKEGLPFDVIQRCTKLSEAKIKKLMTL